MGACWAAWAAVFITEAARVMGVSRPGTGVTNPGGVPPRDFIFGNIRGRSSNVVLNFLDGGVWFSELLTMLWRLSAAGVSAEEWIWAGELRGVLGATIGGCDAIMADLWDIWEQNFFSMASRILEVSLCLSDESERPLICKLSAVLRKDARSCWWTFISPRYINERRDSKS